AVALVGFAGWFLSGIALRRTKRTMWMAQDAKDHAAEAVRHARQARLVADQATELSESAVAVAEQQERRLTNSSLVEWVVAWDDDRRSILVTNAGRDAAFDVTFVVDRDGRRELSTGLEHVPRDGR